jgi:hypothetical protein
METITHIYLVCATNKKSNKHFYIMCIVSDDQGRAKGHVPHKENKDGMGFTWTGLAAINKPATTPPTTLPSGPASDTLKPPVLLIIPAFSIGRKDPDNERISNRPYGRETVSLE